MTGQRAQEPPLTERDCALLVGLADGTLAGRDWPRAEELVDRVPETAALVQRQRRVARALAGGPALPPSLAGVSELRPHAPARRRLLPRPAMLGAGVVGAAAALAIAFLTLLAAGGGGLGVGDVAELEARPAMQSAPYPRGDDPALLATHLDGVDFPNLAPAFAWNATGERADRLDGRATRTVYYEHQGHRIAYTVVSGDPLGVPDGARTVTRDGVEVALVHDGEHEVFAVFERGGHTCVLSGHVLDEETLVRLAGWTGRGSIAF